MGIIRQPKAAFRYIDNSVFQHQPVKPWNKGLVPKWILHRVGLALRANLAAFKGWGVALPPCHLGHLVSARAQLAQVGAWLCRALLLAECKAKPCPYPRSPGGERDPRLARSANPTRGKRPQAAHNPLSPCHLANLSLTAPHFCTVAQAEGRFALSHLGQHVVLSLPPCFPPSSSPTF